MIKDRANSPEEKKKVLDRLFIIWMKHPELRLGQLLSNACPGQSMFYIEDFPLAEDVEKFSDVLVALNKDSENQ